MQGIDLTPTFFLPLSPYQSHSEWIQQMRLKSQGSSLHFLAFTILIASIGWITEKAREFRKNIFFSDYDKAFDCVDHNKLWNILKEMGMAEHLTCFLRNLYAEQEAKVRTGQGTMDWFKIGKGVCQGCTLSPCLFNLYADYILWHAGLDEAQSGTRVAGRNINNLRYADDTTLMIEHEEELKSPN